jgi:hypothetical protein
MAQNKAVAKVGKWEMGKFSTYFPISRNRGNGKWEVSPIGGLPTSHFSRREKQTNQTGKGIL